MINGVLVERTVKDVVPALKTNSDGLRKVLEDLVKQYNAKQTEMEKWKVCSFKVLGHFTVIDYCHCRKRTTYRSFSSKIALGWHRSGQWYEAHSFETFSCGSKE